MNRRTLLYVGLAVLAMIILAIMWGMSRGSLESVGKELVQRALAGDAKGLLALISEDEVSKSRLSEQKLQEFLDQIFLPEMKGFHPDGPVRSFTGQTNIDCVSSVYLMHEDGRMTSLSFVTVRSDEGIQAQDVMHSLLNTVAFIRKKDEPEKGTAFRRNFVKSLDRLMPKLERLQLKGIAVRRSPSFERRFESWRARREFAAEKLRRAETYESQRGAAGKNGL